MLRYAALLIVAGAACLWSAHGIAADSPSPELAYYSIDNVVLLFCAVLVLFMQTGFAAVGAWPVHGLCGIWGGVATGIFGEHALGPQILGSVAIPAWAFVTMFTLFWCLRQMGVLRVTREEELEGLDIAEHGEIEGEA